MPDTPDPSSSNDPASDRDAYVQQWTAICEEIGTSDPNEVLARVQTLKRQMERADVENDEGEGLVTISEVEEVFRDMNEKIEKLRERNAELTEQLEGDDEGGPHQEKEQLAEAGFSDVDDVLREVEQLRAERDELRAERDRLRAKAPDETEAPDEDDALPPEVGELLGVHSVEEARELRRLIEDMYGRLDRLRREHRKLEDAGLSVEGALSMIENMEAQLADLYYHADRDAPDGPTPGSVRGDGGPSLLDDALLHRIEELVDTSPAAADDLTDLVRPLVDRLETLSAEHEPLRDADLNAREAVALIESMEAQLNDLYRREEDRPNAADRLDAIEEVLGISTRREAEELEALAGQMEAQLTSLYEEKEKLQDLGLSSIEDAVDMIESMEAQLDDLYEDKETLRDTQLGSTETQSTFQQLEALYAERQRLQEALGISDADDIIEMVETLTSQLEDLYTGRDETLAPEERHEAQLWSPDAAGPDAEEPSDPDAAEADAPAVRSVERQLEALYREKETLLREGFAGADEVVGRLRSQRRQIEALRREKQACEQWLDRLRSTVGAETILQTLERVRALASEADAPLAEMDAAPADADVEVHLGAAPPVLDRETLERLDEMSAEELEALEVGAVRLRDDGTVAALNDAALRLPGLRTVEDRAAVVGEHFFRDLVPSTNTALFVDRVRAGQRRGELDARFPFTFAGPDEAPRSFAVHLYRSPERDTTWLLFRPS